MFQTLALENFTAFKETSFEWSPGVNVLIGANGTGKTHIMKLMYALQMQGHDAAELKKKLAAVFRPSGDKVSRLVNRKKGSNTARISLSNSAAQSLSLTFDTTRHHTFELQGEWLSSVPPYSFPLKRCSLSLPALSRSMINMSSRSRKSITILSNKLTCLPARECHSMMKSHY